MEVLYRSTGAILLALAIILQAAMVKSMKHACKSHDINVLEEKMAALKKCGESLGVTSLEDMTPDKIPCFIKCMMENAGLVDDQGKPHKENIMRDIDKLDVPADIKDLYKQGMEKCLDAHGNDISANDAKCQSYGPLALCVIKSFKHICHGI